MKKVISLVLIGMLALGLNTGCGKKEKKVEKDIVSQPNISDVKLKGLDIVDFVIVTENNINTIYYSIENNTEEPITFNKISCEMYDKNGNLIYNLDSNLGTIDADDYKDITMNVSADLSSLATVKYNVE